MSCPRLAAELADLPDDAFRQKYDLSVRDAEAVGSRPTVPTKKHQVMPPFGAASGLWVRFHRASIARRDQVK
jgi:hypothetical protein